MSNLQFRRVQPGVYRDTTGRWEIFRRAKRWWTLDRFANRTHYPGPHARLMDAIEALTNHVSRRDEEE